VRKLTQLALLAAALVATPAFAEMKVAVLNYQMALLESDAAKKYARPWKAAPKAFRTA
jgi:outer membrane protein